MTGISAAFLDGGPDGRLHLQHGPIDLVIGVDGGPPGHERACRLAAYEAAHARFSTILEELVSELSFLKAAARPDGPWPRGAVARRMAAAVAPYAASTFITPMAAVAGAVADEVLAAMLAAIPEAGDPDARPSRLYVNNGGDIALHLERGARFEIGIAREDGAALGRFQLSADGPSRGIATSGRGGRSLSMGIADSVTILAASAAEADAAATVVGNAVDLPGHPAILRRPASDVVDDSDLGDLPVVVGVGRLEDAEITQALSHGAAVAEDLICAGRIHRAALFLKDRGRVVSPALPVVLPVPFSEVA